jgi:hypothetical protein
MTLEQAIEHAAEHLPDGWVVRLEAEHNSAWVEAIRPDGSKVMMGDGETDLAEQVRDVVKLAHDEAAAAKITLENALDQT